VSYWICSGNTLLGLGCISVDARAAGEGTLDVSITDPNGQPLTCEVATDDQGAYGISYIPTAPGMHRVDIYFHGQPVAGKPLAVFVQVLIILRLTATKGNWWL